MNTKDVLSDSYIVFGTSGARGLVADFTNNVAAAFAIAFANSLLEKFDFDTIAIAIDNRPSSYSIAQACVKGLEQLNLKVIYYGVLPTPALAYKAMKDSMPCIMVTGSHIPFDRNGLKFYRPNGEITKDDEILILNSEHTFSNIEELDELTLNYGAIEDYIERYEVLFDKNALKNKNIGIYEHSSAGRAIYKKLFERLGAKVTSLGRSDEFVPIDTEAVSAEDKSKALAWSNKYNFDGIFSTDGDGDRPLLADENGEWLRGDILGLLCSQLLSIEALSVPVSCNTAIEKSNFFTKVIRTRIGSPYVISEFEKLANSYKRIAGFEANGGYLLGSNVDYNGKVITALPTRDALLPALVILTQKKPVSLLLENLPKRFTASDRIQNFTNAKSKVLLKDIELDASKFLAELGCKQTYSIDTTDGVRIILKSEDIIHLRPSGNAPELRCYVESHTLERTLDLNKNVLKLLKRIC